MLTKLTIENLKCFGDKNTIPLAPLTLIYGENSGGKSTILLALQLLRRYLLEPRVINLKEFPFKGIITDHDTDRAMTLGVESRDSYASVDGYFIEGIDGYALTSSLAWSDEKQKPELETLDISEFIRSYTETPNMWTFKRNGTSMVAQFAIYHNLNRNHREALVDLMMDNRPAILEGIERLIEADIMQEFLDQNPEELKRLLENMEKLIPQAKGKFYDLLTGKTTETDEAYKRRRTEEEEETAKYRAIADAWRSGLPSWIENCPPSWRTYRVSAEFVEKAEHLRATKYQDVIAFCAQPNWEYFASNSAMIRLPDGNISQPAYEPSRIFTRDIVGLYDPSLFVSHDFFEDQITEVSLIQQVPPKNDVAKEASRLNAQIDSFLPQSFSSIARNIVESMRRIVFIAPLRQRAQRIYSSVSITHDNEQSDIDGSTVPLMLKGDANLCSRVNEWLVRLGVDYSVEIQPLDEEYFKIVLRDTRNPEAPLVQYADVGFGISQILPILVACLSSRPSTILIEQPELHIHPRLQAELGSLFAEAVNTYHHQLIVETHSEHLMLRVQKLIRAKKSKPQDVCVLYVSRGDAGSSVQRLELNESAGFLESWPGGFFPERLQELL